MWTESVFIALALLTFVALVGIFARKIVAKPLNDYISKITKRVKESEELKKEAQGVYDNAVKELNDLPKKLDNIIHLHHYKAEQVVNEEEKKVWQEMANLKARSILRMENIKNTLNEKFKEEMLKVATNSLQDRLQYSQNVGLSDDIEENVNVIQKNRQKIFH